MPRAVHAPISRVDSLTPACRRRSANRRARRSRPDCVAGGRRSRIERRDVAFDDRKQHVRQFLEEGPLLWREIVERVRAIQRDQVIVAPPCESRDGIAHPAAARSPPAPGRSGRAARGSARGRRACRRRAGGSGPGAAAWAARMRRRAGRLRARRANRAEAAHLEIAVRRAVGRECRNADLVDGDRRGDQVLQHSGKASASAARDRFADVCEQSVELHDRIPDETLKLRLRAWRPA